MTFLGEPPASEAAEAAFDQNREEDGYVANFTRLWCWRPDLLSAFAALRASVTDASALTDRDRAVLNTVAAAERSDPYCSLAWGARLAKVSSDETAAQVISGEPARGLSEREAALVYWARAVVQRPGRTTVAEVERLREVGLSDREIFEATALVAFRLAFTAVNSALGAAPDKQLADEAPAQVRAAVRYGRPPSSAPSPS